MPAGTVWLVGRCMEARGMQELWLRQRPELLEALRQQAVVQSVESSNRIEGVEVAPERLLPVVLGADRPRDRPEEELAGYRAALDYVYGLRYPVLVDSALILRLHGLCQGGQCGDAGQFKARDNSIIEIGPGNERRVRFEPVPAAQTPALVRQLCDNYRDLADGDRHPPLVLVAAFVFDFLCIHPFRDGNGRVSRLLTALLLLQHGFAVSRFVALERLVEDQKAEYYRVLQASSQGWHQGGNDLLPFLNFFLSTLKEAYARLQTRVEQASGGPAKGLMVRELVLGWNHQFSLADASAQAPFATPHLVKKVLADLKAQGLVELQGRGRGAKWRKRAR